MFSDSFRERLTTGKYTEWAATLTEDHMEALLWLIGEYGYRASLIRDLLEEQEKAVFMQHDGFARLKLAQETIVRVFEGERLDVEETKRRIRGAVANARAGGEDPSRSSNA